MAAESYQRLAQFFFVNSGPHAHRASPTAPRTGPRPSPPRATASDLGAFVLEALSRARGGGWVAGGGVSYVVKRESRREQKRAEESRSLLPKESDTPWTLEQTERWHDAHASSLDPRLHAPTVVLVERHLLDLARVLDRVLEYTRVGERERVCVCECERERKDVLPPPPAREQQTQ